MSQLLETTAPICDIGLCQIGGLEFERIRHLFALDEDHLLVHSLLGGLIDRDLEDRWQPFAETSYRSREEREEGEL